MPREVEELLADAELPREAGERVVVQPRLPAEHPPAHRPRLPERPGRAAGGDLGDDGELDCGNDLPEPQLRARRTDHGPTSGRGHGSAHIGPRYVGQHAPAPRRGADDEQPARGGDDDASPPGASASVERGAEERLDRLVLVEQRGEQPDLGAGEPRERTEARSGGRGDLGTPVAPDHRQHVLPPGFRRCRAPAPPMGEACRDEDEFAPGFSGPAG
ncbi:hypothetical protein [Pseudonocardia nigra]|uniref:hypothetical protein n=1 Tax=Pseudonocardia nigra TaxID=1921578 RepID=UPI001C5CCB11|nr:hypothetical protein [Pseudonocardia nigra]